MGDGTRLGVRFAAGGKNRHNSCGEGGSKQQFHGFTRSGSSFFSSSGVWRVLKVEGGRHGSNEVIGRGGGRATIQSLTTTKRSWPPSYVGVPIQLPARNSCCKRRPASNTPCVRASRGWAIARSGERASIVIAP